MPDLRWVQDPDPVCCTSGCQFATAKRLMMAAQAIVDERRDGVSYALWCDRGGHAFSEDDPGRIIIPAASALDDQGNEIIIKAQAVCGEHARGMNKRITRPPAEITRPRYDPEYTRQPETEPGIGKDDH